MLILFRKFKVEADITIIKKSRT